MGITGTRLFLAVSSMGRLFKGGNGLMRITKGRVIEGLGVSLKSRNPYSLILSLERLHGEELRQVELLVFGYFMGQLPIPRKISLQCPRTMVPGAKGLWLHPKPN